MKIHKKLSIDKIVIEFHLYLKNLRGAAERTCIHYTDNTRKFLVAIYGKGPVNLRNLEAVQILRYVISQMKKYHPKTVQLICSSLKSFFGFLQMQGLCDQCLVHAIPPISNRRWSQIPKYLTEGQLDKLLSSFDQSTTYGLRNYAMTLCMAQLGLRAGEVAQFRLDQIDWRQGIIQIPTNKGRRMSTLPLPREIGLAIVAYLKKGRPKTDERNVFVTHRAPVGGRLDRRQIGSIIRITLRRLGIHVPCTGSHVLRHTAATRLIQKGARLKDIADLLRHRSIETTTIYAKVDLPKLFEVTMPWLQS